MPLTGTLTRELSGFAAVPPFKMRVCECEECKERRLIILQRLANKRAGGALFLMAHREGRFTARRLKPASRLDQEINAVATTM